MNIKIIRNFTGAKAELDRISSRSDFFDSKKQKAVEVIIKAVRREGDRAVLGYSRKFDDVPAKKLRVSPAELRSALSRLEPEHALLFKRVIKNVKSFHKAQVKRSWKKSFGHCTLGQKIDPVSTAGIYVPGGRAPLISTVFMTVVPAQVAGVEDIIVTSPPDKSGGVNPYILAALEMLGVSNVFCAGGAQAVAAMAYGTRTIPKVDKIAGPGNVYVTLAKKAVFGEVDIDMLAGPSEVLILADSSARADFIAADLLAQAEHDTLSASILVTTSGQLAEEVCRQMSRQIGDLKKNKETIRKSLALWGRIIVLDSLAKGVELVNRFAPEHLEVIVRQKNIIGKIKNAGAIFIGNFSPVVLGDYIAGPSHVLPTNRTARFCSGLSVDTFLKSSSLIAYPGKDPSALRDAGQLASLEGLEGHVRSSEIR